MSLVNRKGADSLRRQVHRSKGKPTGPVEHTRASLLESEILAHFDELHSEDRWNVDEIERQLIDDELTDLDRKFSDIGLTKGVVMFSPSGASKCPRELALKAFKAKKDEQTSYPYQRRWTRNSTAVHRATQRDLLYAERLPNARFKVARTDEGRPAWERNIAKVVKITHKGVTFEVYGMVDGFLDYKDGSRVGFEFKTKSTTIAAVGDYKMRECSPDHRLQTVAYSLLFGIDEYLIVYESVAKDGWMKGAQARADMRAFYVKVTDADREALLDKWAAIAEAYYNGEIPNPDFSKCLFCPYKTRCEEVEAVE